MNAHMSKPMEIELLVKTLKVVAVAVWRAD